MNLTHTCTLLTSPLHTTAHTHTHSRTHATHAHHARDSRQPAHTRDGVHMATGGRMLRRTPPKRATVSHWPLVDGCPGANSPAPCPQQAPLSAGHPASLVARVPLPYPCTPRPRAVPGNPQDYWPDVQYTPRAARPHA